MVGEWSEFQGNGKEHWATSQETLVLGFPAVTWWPFSAPLDPLLERTVCVIGLSGEE